MKKPRVYATLGVLTAVLAAIVLIPLPYRVICPLEIKASDAEQVYVGFEGDLEEVYVEAGQRISPGDKIAQLVNQDLELKIAEQQRKRDELAIEVATLKKQQGVRGSNVAGQVGIMQRALEAANNQLENMQMDQELLTLVAGSSGTVIAAPSEKQPPTDDRLPRWTGSTLNPKNLGATMQQGRLFCQIGDPRRMDAVIIVDQSEVDFIHAGQRVEIKVDALPGDTFESEIKHLSPEELRVASPQLSNKHNGEIETETDETGRERPISTSYPALALLDDSEGVIRPGMRGRAKIHAGYQTLGQRFWRYVTRTFNFKL